MVVFDLDYTLWPVWVDTHVDPPFQPHRTVFGSAVHRHCRDIHLFPDVARVIADLQAQGIKIGIASRTSAPDAARQLMKILLLPGCTSALRHEAAFPDCALSKATTHVTVAVPLASVIHFAQIYPGDKQAHFKALHSDSGVEYCDMLFFDDERRNIVSVGGGLGVHAVHVDDEEGETWELYQREMEAWRKKRQQQNR